MYVGWFQLQMQFVVEIKKNYRNIRNSETLSKDGNEILTT